MAHLKRDLEGKIEEANELNERLLALEELRKQEQAEYKKKENAMEQEYRTMESTLSAEVKLASKKNYHIKSRKGNINKRKNCMFYVTLRQLGS